MIVRPRPHWLRLLFVWRGSILSQILPQLALTLALAVVVTLLHGQVLRWKVPMNFVPFSLIGLTLAIFLGFRNSTSYGRWWEARMLWGALLIDCRAAVRQALTLPEGGGEARVLALRLIALVHALRHQLRGSDPAADLARLLPAAEAQRVMAARYRPAMLLLMAGEWLRDLRVQGRAEAAIVPALEGPLDRIGAAIGGCERLANTPIPFTYGVIIHRTIYLYCLLLPFGLVDAIGPMTPVIVVLVAYTFFALEALGSEIEEPFGEAPNDLALDAICWSIETSVLESIGDADWPPQPQARDYVLT
ncbi:bestrophin family protein [Pseudacidovorax sp. RU35E]|uniref:bestrophin family protein n=1 Tax=Pseudacidovorax sp. RU35E TaxID=1907403 RepID=UPI00095587FD|nr:bestrophin family ion channel [Pseudacidovorax sp. RU35E]SIQ12377.1 putative membrane protein [Pseudacidovorax sp. RU35E]